MSIEATEKTFEEARELISSNIIMEQIKFAVLTVFKIFGTKIKDHPSPKLHLQNDGCVSITFIHPHYNIWIDICGKAMCEIYFIDPRTRTERLADHFILTDLEPEVKSWLRIVLKEDKKNERRI